METGLNDGTKPEHITARVFNSDTVTLPVLSPAYLDFVTATPSTQDGLNVQRPSVAIASGQTGYYYGLVVTPGGILPNTYGDVVIFGFIANVPIIANTRANTGTPYSTQAAITAGSGLTVDTTNNYLTGLTLISKSQSNIAPAILLDTIPANQGNGTTPATGVVFLYNARVLINFK